MEIGEFNNRLQAEVEDLKDGFRINRSAFLIWFLRNIFYLNEQTSIDSVCDGSNDKGIDGIWVDEDSEEIYIFQTKFSPLDQGYQGERDIREFLGVGRWFNSEQKVEELRNSLANDQLKRLLEKGEIGDRISKGYIVKFIFATNKIFDIGAKEFLGGVENIESYDKNDLFEKYIYLAEEEIENTPKKLKITNEGHISYTGDPENEAIVLILPAKEILKLDGIQNRSLFSRNVRYWIGKTRVNKDIVKTLNEVREHPKFFLYHNGITITCNSFNLDLDRKEILLEGYQIINGCQSIISFYENKRVLTENIHILAKIIKLPPISPLIKKITKNTNNQNSIRIQDLKSDDRIQRNLKNKFQDMFGQRVLYKIKRGEDEQGFNDVINMDFGAQLIESFYLEKPHNTHLKNKMFTERYGDIFSRKIGPENIYLAYTIHRIILENIKEIENLPMRNYGLSRFAILRFIKTILEKDPKGKEIIENPEVCLDEQNITILEESLKYLFKLIAMDINAYIKNFIEEHEGFFDYKNLFKRENFIVRMNNEIFSAHKKGLIRHPEDAFKEIIKKFSEQP